MKETVLRFLWPHIAIGALTVVLGLLTLLSWRARRGSWIHQARVTVLATLVTLSGGVALSSCSQDDDRSSGDGDGEMVPMCYAATIQPTPDAGTPPVPPMCYAPMEVRDAASPNEPRPQPMCYAPAVATPPGGDDAPDAAAQPQPQRMCYAPRQATPPTERTDS